MTNKSIVWSCGIAIGVVGLALLIAATVMIRSYDRIEADQTAAKAEQVLRALEADLNQLAISNRDYAEWDDAATFVGDRNPNFIGSNFKYETLEGMHVDIVWIIDAKGQALFSAAIDGQRAKRLTTAPDSLYSIVAPHLKESLQARESSLARLVTTSSGLLAFSAKEIRQSDKSGPTGAIMIFARFIGDEVLGRVRQTSGLPVTLVAGEQVGWSQPVRSSTTLTAAAGGDKQVDVVVVSDDLIEGRALLRDLDRRVVGIVTTTAQRSVAALGRRTTWALMGAVIGIVLLAGAAIVVLLMRLQRSWNSRELAERRHRNIVGSLEESVAIADMNTGEIVDANDALARMMGCRLDEIAAFKLQDIYLDLPDLTSLFSGEESSAVHECRMRALDGRLIDAEVSVARVIDNGAALICVVGRDLRLRRQLERQERENKRKLTAMSQTDAITGLPNRSYLHAKLPRLLQSLAGSDRLLSLLYIDVDQFKNINEWRGHARGDELLKVLAKRLRASIAADDILVRMGGDEFVIIASLMPDQTAIGALARRVLDTVQAPTALQDGVATVTASIGIGVYPTDGIDAESLLKHADIALYQAKEQGRNCYRFFAADMNVQLSEHVALEQALRHALGTDQLFVEYQPVVDAYTGILTSFEALVRWRHPELGLIPPLRFIPVAEKSGLIIQVGEEVLRKVIMQQYLWHKEKVPLAPVAINVSPMQFERTDFPILVHELCLAHDLDPKWLHFEVTESSWLQESNKHIVALDTLRSQGSRVSIDDFGTGFSNLGYLKQLPIDTIKIDRSFVRNVTTDSSDAAIVKSIIAIARNLHLDTVAEGVETVEQLDKLREFGCQKVQGYYFSKPIPAQQCRALLEQLGESRRLTETVKARAFKLA